MARHCQAASGPVTATADSPNRQRCPPQHHSRAQHTSAQHSTAWPCGGSRPTAEASNPQRRSLARSPDSIVTTTTCHPTSTSARARPLSPQHSDLARHPHRTAPHRTAAAPADGCQSARLTDPRLLLFVSKINRLTSSQFATSPIPNPAKARREKNHDNPKCPPSAPSPRQRARPPLSAPPPR